jgi:hypothetical protein
MRKLLLVGLLSVASMAAAQDARNAVGAAVIGNPYAVGVAADYERLFGSVSLGARFVSLSYDWEDGSYVEEGNARGLDLLARYYFAGSGFKGFYLGAGAGYYESDWDWRDRNTNPSRGSGDSELWNLSAIAGYKHFLSPNFYLDLFGMLGRWEGKSSNESTGTRKSQLGSYFAVGAGVGLVF